MAACGSAINAIFVLHANKIVAIEIQEIRGPFIGAQILLLQFQTHLLWVLVAGIGVVDRNREQPA